MSLISEQLFGECEFMEVLYSLLPFAYVTISGLRTECHLRNQIKNNQDILMRPFLKKKKKKEFALVNPEKFDSDGVNTVHSYSFFTFTIIVQQLSACCIFSEC